jgi:hypothetical protein
VSEGGSSPFWKRPIVWVLLVFNVAVLGTCTAEMSSCDKDVETGCPEVAGLILTSFVVIWLFGNILLPLIFLAAGALRRRVRRGKTLKGSRGNRADQRRALRASARHRRGSLR